MTLDELYGIQPLENNAIATTEVVKGKPDLYVYYYIYDIASNDNVDIVYCTTSNKFVYIFLDTYIYIYLYIYIFI
jgi:hypothetical protein